MEQKMSSKLNVIYNQKLLEFHKKISNYKITSDKYNKSNRREIPSWFQELSIDQMDILNNLQNCIQNDFYEGMTKRVRLALKDFGVRTRIPNLVAKYAILYSKLYPIDFLQKIKEYLGVVSNAVSKKTELLHYAFERRLIVSGIVYLGLPSLFMKLDFCLNDPEIIEKKLNYIHMKKVTPKKYSSPYLEPFSIYGKSWCEIEKNKIHNENVNVQIKQQKLKENSINIRKKQKENLIRNLELKIKYGGPMHPLDVLFNKPALDNIFEDNKGITKNKVVKSGGVKVNSIVEHFEYDNIMNESQSENSITINSMNEVLKDESHKPTIENLYITKKGNPKDILSTTSGDAMSYSNDSSSFVMKFINTKAHIRLKETCTFMYEYDDVNEESDLEEEIVNDFSFSINSEEDNKAVEKFEKITDFEKKSIGNHSVNIFNNSLATSKLLDRRLSTILENLAVIDNQSKTEDLMIRMFNCQINSFKNYRFNYNNRIENYTKYTGENNKNNQLRLESSLSDESDDLEYNDKSSVLSPVKIQEIISNKSKSELLIDFVDIVDQSEESYNEIQEVHIYDEILTELRKLPKWKQLESVLRFLDILGDPIAGLPNIIGLDELVYWYESRLNPHKNIVLSEIKANTLNKPVYSWKSPKPIIMNIPVPPNPSNKEKHSSTFTWDKKNMALKINKEITDGYVKKIKELVLSNTREKYQPFKTLNNKNEKLSRNFKKTFHSYFPNKEDGIMFLIAPKFK